MNEIEDTFRPVYGLPCWNVHCGYGSFLTMEFGEPRLLIDETMLNTPSLKGRLRRRRRLVKVTGQWHFWLEQCQWFVFQDGRRQGSWHNDHTVCRAIAALGGQKLVSVTVNRLMGRSHFEFDLGARLFTRPYGRSNDAQMGQWHLYEPDGWVLTFQGDGRYSRQPGDTRPEENVWRFPSD